MRRISFIIAILGIFILLTILNYNSPMVIKNPQEIANLRENQKVLVSGKVIDERTHEKSKTLILENEIKLTCQKNCASFTNKNITALGFIETWTPKPRIKVLKITINN